MSNEFLSQDEVDALLQGVTGEEDAPAAEEPEGGVRNYDIASQERIVRGRMPAFELVNDRFGRLIRAGIFNFMRKSPEVSVGTVRVIKYSEFVRNVAVPTNLNLVSLKPLRGMALVVIDPNLVFTVVDNLFGGDSQVHSRIEGREFSGTEMRIIQRLLDVLLEEYRRAWAPAHPIGFEYVRSEMHTQFATIATPNEIVLVTSFKIELGEAGGDVHIVIPYASVEPIRDKLFNGLAGDSTEPDKRWSALLRHQVQDAEVEMTAVLAKLPVDVRALLAMRAGDVIGFDLPKRIIAGVEGVPLFDCRYGTLNGRYAVKVERALSNRIPGEPPHGQ
jgi:flagellar motor switch protein FliM